jgi:hypothetical protein
VTTAEHPQGLWGKGIGLALSDTGDDMNIDRYDTIGPDRPMGDREGAEENWTPEKVKEVSKEEVKNPKDEPEPDIEESERKD